MAGILITGAAGFIGFHLASRLLKEGFSVTGIDNLNNYYDPSIKRDRLACLGIDVDTSAEGQRLTSSVYPGFSFYKICLEDQGAMEDLFRKGGFGTVVHLAAQAGVRYSLENPNAYINSNITGFMHLTECCRKYPPRHLVYASSSSVYGLNGTLPLSVNQGIAHPISIYAATKKSNELFAHTYSHLFGLPTTGLRFFTVYGPWGRPDMALFLFAKAILEDRPIDVYNHGEMWRDFTYIDDIIEGICRVIPKPPLPDPAWDDKEVNPATSSAPYKIYNIGNNSPVNLMSFIKAIEEKLNKKATVNLLPIQPGDVPHTYSDISELTRDTGYLPKTDIYSGISQFVDWYLEYYRIIKNN